jgi:hypothetical protein
MSNELDASLLAAFDSTKNALRVTDADSSTLTSGDDTTTTLTTSSGQKILVGGSGINQIIDLGDLTTYDNGKTYEITNGSSEFIQVQNSDLSTCYRLPPGTRAVFSLVDNSSSAGAWTTAPSPVVYKVGDDLQEVPGQGCKPLFTEFNSGTASAVGTAAFDGTLSVDLRTGTTTSGYSGRRLTTGASANGAIHLDRVVGFSALSTVSDEYVVNIGYGNGASSATLGSNFVGFIYDRATYGANWQLGYAAGAGLSVIDSGVAVTTALQRLQCEHDSANGRADWFIDGTHVGDYTGTLPDLATDIYRDVIGKSAGTTQTNMYINNWRTIKTWASARV